MMLPLQGIKVIDFGDAWSSPFACTMLADAGADVIRIEDIHRQLSTIRGPMNPIGPLDGYPDRLPGAHPWNQYYLMNTTERNKRGITLDLNHPLARGAFERLVRDCDVFATNYTPRAIEQLRLTFDDIKALNPRAVYAHVTGYGCDGAMRDTVALGSTIDAWTGHMGLRGYPETTPYDTAQSYESDSAGGAMLAFAIVAALEERDRSGEPQCVELSLAETLLQFLAQPILESVVTGEVPTLYGNRSPEWAPQGAYPCDDEDRWITIAATTNGQWRELCEVLQLGESPDLTSAERREREDAIDASIAAATCRWDAVELMRSLAERDIPAMMVYLDSEILTQPDLTGGDFLQAAWHEDTGERLYPGPVWRSSSRPMKIQRPHFGLGEHNHEVLCDQLGMTESEYEQMIKDGAIGQRYSFWPQLSQT